MKKLLILIFVIPAYVYSYNQLYVSKVLAKTQTNNFLIASGVDFRGAGTLLKGQKFNGELSGTNFANNDMNVVPLTGTIKIPGQVTDLSGSNFSNVNLVSSSFKGANLQNAIFNEADINWTDFSGANLRGAQFKDTKNISKARFYNATMPDGSVLSYGSWTDSNGSVFNAYAAKKES